MEHVRVQELANSYKKLTPDQGYLLLDNRTYRTYSQAVTKDTRPFEAVAI